MELKKIRYFLRIVEKGGLSKAAESLYLTQPTMSRFLAKLEEEAEILLFRRRQDSTLELTQAGSIYLQAAQQIDGIWQDMQTKLTQLKEAQSEVLRFGYDDDTKYPLIHTYVDAIHTEFPDITLQYHSLNSAQIQKAVLDGSLDLGMTSYYRFSDQLSYTHIREKEVDLVVSNTHPLARFSYCIPGQEDLRFSLSELPADTPFVLMREGHVLRQAVDHYLETIGIVPQVPTTYFRHDLQGQILAESNTLVGFCPRRSNRDPRLSYVALDPPFFHKRGICYRKGNTLTPAEKLLINML